MADTLTLNDQDVFQLLYDATAGLLRGGWLGPVLDADLRSHYAQLVQAAQPHGCCYWLLDMRRRNWHMPGFRHWFCTEFVAAVRAALAQPVFIAYVLSPRHRGASETTGEQAAQQRSREQQVYPGAFADEAAALAWLRQQQRLAASQLG